MKRRPSSRRTGRLIYAASDVCPDMLYATGLITPDPFLWFATDQGCIVVVTPLELGRAQKQAKPGAVVLSQQEAKREWRVSSRRLRTESLIAGLTRHAGISVWETPDSFPLGLARRLEKRGVRLKTVPDFFPERRRKTAEEVAHVREGVALAEAGLDRALHLLRESNVGQDGVLVWRDAPLTAEILRGEIDAEIARCGGTASQTIAAPGAQAADPHQCGSGPLNAGVPIVLDIFPRVDATGYFGDLTRTVVKGRAPDLARDAFAAVREAQSRALAAVHAGVKGSVVHRAAAETLEDAGFETDLLASPPHGFIHGTGHGVGLAVHEGPRVNKRADQPLEEGNVVTIEPGLYYPEWGGVRLEDVVVVRPDGCENLTSAEKFLEIE